MAARKVDANRRRRHERDPYVIAARREGYRSRAAYKLAEVDDRDRILARGATVVDLGAAPGGWSQVALERVGDTGAVFALDILEILPIPGLTVIGGDFREDQVLEALDEALAGRPVDVLLSDMAPNASGIKVADQARAMHLAELALDFAAGRLAPGGTALVKVFNGAGLDELRREMVRRFDRVAFRKPASSRAGSAEIYLLGRGFVV